MSRFVRFLRLTRILPVWRALVVAGALGLVVAALPALPRGSAGGATENPTALPGARFGPPPRPGGRFGRPPDLIGRSTSRVGVAPAGPGDEPWELLSALALAGGAGGLLLSTRNERQQPATPSPTAQDVATLREEVERLRREQQHLQAAVAWQERLLATGDRAEPAAGQISPPE